MSSVFVSKINRITNGEDITAHYLEDSENEFKFFRYKNKVYAVRYDLDSIDAFDYVFLWRSHKDETTEPPPETEDMLGYGHVGAVTK